VVRPTSVTVGIPVSDLARARAWYDAVLDRCVALEPVPGIVEYELAGIWIQLMGGQRGSSGWVLRYGVDDLQGERQRLQECGVNVGDIETVPGLISFCGFRDPDGNKLSCYHLLDSA
jgi:predicted enzyme related to lactoylglutathione lyase